VPCLTYHDLPGGWVPEALLNIIVVLDYMKALIKSIWSDSVTVSLEDYVPEDSDHFGLWLEFRVGLETSAAADDFRVLVCTPDWIKQELDCKPVWARHVLLVARFDLPVILAELQSLVARCSGPDWPSIATKLSRYAAWEFEDYVQ